MTLIKSISGFRGTIGGKPDNGLTPIDIVKLTSSFICLIRRSGVKRPRIVVGRDGRLSGTMVNQLVCGNLQAMGADVIDIGLSTTPTVEVAVTEMKADGGVILTASHNPREWNALKLLNNKGEFISKEDGKLPTDHVITILNIKIPGMVFVTIVELTVMLFVWFVYRFKFFKVELIKKIIEIIF